MKVSHTPHVGIVAGWGQFPVEVARRFAQQGWELSVVALKNHADVADFEPLTHRVAELGVLKIGKHIRYLKQQGVERVAMAGKIFKEKILYHGGGWLTHSPDWTCLSIMAGSFITRTQDARDDTLLTSVVKEYERKGLAVMSIGEAAPEVVVEAGCLSARRPSRKTHLDIQFGWDIAKQMGGLDIGQSITVKGQVVLGVEAIEGTDALIARTAVLCPQGGFTLIKVAKPQQDMRFDVPTIGARTVAQMAKAGGAAIAVEAGRTIFVEREATLALAKQHRISLVALEGAELMDNGATPATVAKAA